MERAEPLLHARLTAIVVSVIGGLALVASGAPSAGSPKANTSTVDRQPPLAVTSIYPASNARGLIVTTGGWLYCANTKRMARAARYTLLCGKFAKDGYTADNLRAKRHVDWGNPVYLAQFAREIARVHRQVGGPLVFVGVSYSGFGMATLASHHPELRPDYLIVVDSYLDLVARWRHGSKSTRREITTETGRSLAELRARSVDLQGLATLVREGTRLSVIWSVTPAERRLFNGATCARDVNAEPLSRLARILRRPVVGWVTQGEHGFDLWNNEAAILQGNNPGRMVRFAPSGRIPTGSYCT